MMPDWIGGRNVYPSWIGIIAQEIKEYIEKVRLNSTIILNKVLNSYLNFKNWKF